MLKSPSGFRVGRCEQMRLYPCHLFIGSLQHLKQGARVVLVVRVSTPQQELNKNDEDQLQNLLTVASSRGLIVVDVFKHTGSGKDPSWLVKPASLAKDLNASLLFESTSRILRSEHFDPKTCPTARPTMLDLEGLEQWTGGVKLYTYLDPDASASEERHLQTRRGQLLKQQEGGRPPHRTYKKRDEQVKLAAVMAICQGESYRTVAEKFTVPASSLQGWVKKYKKLSC